MFFWGFLAIKYLSVTHYHIKFDFYYLFILFFEKKNLVSSFLRLKLALKSYFPLNCFSKNMLKAKTNRVDGAVICIIQGLFRIDFRTSISLWHKNISKINIKMRKYCHCYAAFLCWLDSSLTASQISTLFLYFLAFCSKFFSSNYSKNPHKHRR